MDSMFIMAAMDRLGEVRAAHVKLSELVLQLDYSAHPNHDAAGPIVVARMHVREVAERLDATGEMLRRVLAASAEAA